MQGESNTIKNGLRDVVDFEIGLNVVELGLIREVEVEEDKVTITMILTSPMCPMASFMMNQVQERAEELTEKEVEVVLGQEMWQREMMEEEAREKLGL